MNIIFELGRGEHYEWDTFQVATEGGELYVRWGSGCSCGGIEDFDWDRATVNLVVDAYDEWSSETHRDHAVDRVDLLRTIMPWKMLEWEAEDDTETAGTPVGEPVLPDADAGDPDDGLYVMMLTFDGHDRLREYVAHQAKTSAPAPRLMVSSKVLDAV